MPKKLLRGPKIHYFGGFDDGGDEFDEGSGYGAYKLSYDAWLESDYCLEDYDNDGELGTKADYEFWWFEVMGFTDDPIY